MKKPSRSVLRPAVLLLMLALWVGCDSGGDGGDATPPAPRGTLAGVVREAGTQTPIPSLTVMLGSIQTTTGPDGRFEFRDVPLGPKTITIGATRFDAYTHEITLQAGSNTHDVSLPRRTYYQHNTNAGNIGMYLPSGVATFRGVIFYVTPFTVDGRGFASGAPVTVPNPPYPGAAERLNAQAAGLRQRSLQMAAEHGLALMGVQFESDQSTVVLAALEQIAAQSGHPELAQAPLLMVGMSSGGCLAYNFAVNNSARVIGFVSQKGHCHTVLAAGGAKSVPGYFFLGGLDGPPPDIHSITKVFQENRPAGALWAVAIEPNAGHTPITDLDLLARWMDAVIRARLPATVTPGAPVTLNALDETRGWLGNRGTFSVAEYARYDANKQQASWLPSAQTAQDWKNFVFR